MSRLSVIFYALCVLHSHTAQASPDAVYRALNRDGKVAAQKLFIEDYVALVEKRLQTLDNFIDVLLNPGEDACNLLCESRLIASFRIEHPADTTDLIRYVLTSTCYGWLSDKSHRGLALEQLDTVARQANLVHQLSWTEKEREFFRLGLGDILRSYGGDSPHNSSFSTLKELWQRALKEDKKEGIKRILSDDSNVQVPRSIGPSTRAAAELACVGR